MVSPDGWRVTTFQEVFSQPSSTDFIKLLSWCFSSAVSLHHMNEVLATTVQQREAIPVTTATPEPEGSQVQAPSDGPVHQTGTPPLPVSPLLDIPFVGTPLVRCPFTEFVDGPMHKKWDHSSSSTLGDQCNKQNHVDSQEARARSEYSSTKGEEDMPKLASEPRPSSEPQGQEPTSTPSSPTKVTVDPGDGTVVETSRSTRDQDSESNANHSGASSDLDASRENVADSDMESVSRDCFMCSDTEEVTIRITQKKYRKMVWASCRLGRGGLWSEAQLKWISNSCQAVWGHMKALILSLKQYHAHYYWLYQKGMTRAMVGLQGLHLGNTFRFSNVSSSVGRKSFCPWCFKLGEHQGDSHPS